MLKIFDNLGSTAIRDQPAKYIVLPQTGFNQDMQETKLSSSGVVQTNNLFSYKEIQPQARFAEQYKYNGILSSESSSDDENQKNVKEKRFYNNCEYVVVSENDNSTKEYNSESNFKNIDQNPSLSSYIAVCCSVM